MSDWQSFSMWPAKWFIAVPTSSSRFSEQQSLFSSERKRIWSTATNTHGRSMDVNAELNVSSYGYRAKAGRIEQVLFDEGLRQHMLRVYNYMGLGLVMTGLVAVMIGTTPAFYATILSTPLKWVAILAPLPFAFFFALRIRSISASSAQALFWVFCAVMGLSLASIFLVF